MAASAVTHGTEIPVSGVTSMDHTADVGLEIEADDRAELFGRAAAGMMHLILERRPERVDEIRELRASSEDLAGLLREWLRELLYWHEVEGFSVAGAEFRRLEPTGLDASVRGGPAPGTPIREIKGVTLHGLVAEEREEGWYGRIIFDV
jgi:SHS2 domain-containing protein